MHFKAAALTLVAVAATSATPMDNGMIHQHVTIQQPNQLCISQVPYQVCAEGYRPETVYPQTLPMVCMDNDSNEASQAREQIREGKTLPELKRKPAYEVQHMQRRAPRTCTKKNENETDMDEPRPTDIRKKMRSNWVPILRTTGSSSYKDNEQYEKEYSYKNNKKYQEQDYNKEHERNEHRSRQMTQEQEKEWLSEVTDKQSTKENHLNEYMTVNGEQRPRLDMHRIMSMPEHAYEQWEQKIQEVAQSPENAWWLAKFEQQLPLIYFTRVNGLRDKIATYYPEKDSQRQLQSQFKRAVKRAYLFLVQQVILERTHMPRDEQVLLYPSLDAMVNKVWATLKLELTSEEVENVEESVRVYLENLRNERPDDYEMKFQLPTKMSQNTDLKKITENLLKIAQTGLRLAAQKEHKYTDPRSEHQKWAFTDEEAEREVEEARRWFSKMNSNQSNKQTDEQRNKKYEQKDSYEDNENGQWTMNENNDEANSLFNKLKVAIRSFEKTIRGKSSNTDA